MWRIPFRHNKSKNVAHRADDFKKLLQYITRLASHKMGYPVSLLTFIGHVNNRELGILPDSLANVLLNNVGDPFKDSLTSLMEVKEHERKLIEILEKYYGLATNEARGYVTTGGTEGNFAALWWSRRYLINHLLSTIIKNDDSIKLKVKEEQELLSSLTKIPTNDYKTRAVELQKIIDLRNAITADKNISQEMLTPTVFFSKASTHYSIPKIAEILHLNIRPLTSDSDGAVDLNNFKKELMIHLEAHPHSSVIFVANIGTTITGAIDNVPAIKKILDETPRKPLYTIHMDGALTGFVLPILKPFGEIDNYFEALGVNTLAVSAHKYPGLSQPCGIILARKGFLEKAFEKSERSIDYVGDILDITITGSRSGLNVLMFYNALLTLGLDKNNDTLQAMVDDNLNNARYLYERLVEIFGTENVHYPFHFNVMFPRPSMALARKYQLMLTGNRATICVLTNITKKLIDQFVHDLKLDKEEVMKTTKTEHKILNLEKEHLKSATELFIKAFCNSEPVTKHLGITHDDYEPFAKAVLQKAINDGLSKVIVDGQNKVLACIVVEDLADPFLPKLADYPKLKPVFGLLEELSKPFVEQRKFLKGKIAHYWIAAVEKDLMGHGLFKELNTETIKMSSAKGFDFAYAEFTNEISEKIIKQFEVIEICNRVKYDNYSEQNQKPFKGLKGGAASYIAAIRPGIKLDSLKNCYTIESRHSLA